MLRRILFGFILGLLSINIILLVQKYLLHEEYPNIFGFSYALVISGSMEPTLQVYDLAFYRTKEYYTVGDIVIFKENQSLVTHRIIGQENDEFITKGDANPTADIAKLATEHIKGVLWFKFPVTFLFLGMFTLISLLLGSLVYAHLRSNFQGIGRVEVASFYLDGQYTDSFTIGLENLSAHSTNFLPFTIVNYTEETQSEVVLEYSIYIQTTNNLPLSFSLGAYSDPNYISNIRFTYDETTNCYIGTGGILPLTPTRHEYQLQIDFSDQSAKYSTEIDAISLKIIAKQKEGSP